MKFTEEIASQLKEKYSLENHVINKWRYRNRIPKKYFKQSDKKFNEFDIENAVNILSDKRINLTTLAKLAKLERSHFSDYVAERRQLNYEVFLALKKAINTVKIEISKLISLFEKRTHSTADERAILEIFDKKYFFVNHTINSSFSNKLSGFRNKKRIDFPFEHSDEVVQGLIMLRLSLNI